MTNIPTELLRTLVAVVDLRSFTKAAHSLGITQPAVSAQIKRLQVLLGSELLDKSAPGVSLTSAGEVVVGYARQLLSINDQILDLSSPVALAHPVRIGMTGDFVAAALASCLPRIRKAHPELSFRFQSGGIDPLLRALREAELDLVVGLLSPDSVPEARYRWSDEMVWLSRAAQPLHLNNDKVPLVSYGDDCLFYRAAVSALNQAGMQAELIYCGSSLAGLVGAVAAGLGIMVLPRSHADIAGLAICDDMRLPPLPPVSFGVHVRDGSGRELREGLAQMIDETLAPRGAPTDRIETRIPI